MLLLLPSWAEAATLFADLVAACCARGRPPFVAVLGDGAPDGSEHQARHSEQITRNAMSMLGLPKDHLLFVGIRQGSLPMPDHALFATLRLAMVQLSWRQDCNLIAACSAEIQHGDVAAAWLLASAMADGLGLPLIAAVKNVLF
jgi:hypothetical protein